MRRSSPTRQLLPAEWTEVLGQVQQALEAADAAAAKRAEALENTATPPEASWQSSLDQARQRLDHLTTYADRASHVIAGADVALGAGEDSLHSWLSATEAARRRLAEWVGRAVG